MSKNTVNSKAEGNDGPVRYKGQTKQNHQKGAAGVSKKTAAKHVKDESGGAAKNTTKKQQNSI